MSNPSGLEIFERVVAAGGRLLRVEGDLPGPSPEMLVLTLDVGRIVIRPGEDGLRVEQIADRSALPDDLEVLDESEPWWRLLGQPLTAAWPGGVEDGIGARGLGSLMVLKLRFREASNNTRIVRLEATGRALRSAIEQVEQA